jgi:transcriptional regulator with XRE-family HTH domain
MPGITDKITWLLADRGLKRRTLADALGVTPQTVSDILNGRSQITVAHLRRLVEFFGLRADYWLDDSRLEPTRFDDRISGLQRKVAELADGWVLRCEDPAPILRRLLTFASERQAEYEQRFGRITADERRLLGSPPEGEGRVGRVQREDG